MICRRASFTYLKHVRATLGTLENIVRILARNASALILLLAISAYAQTPPDFTGRWQLETKAAEQRQLDVKQNGSSLRVETIVTNAKGTRRLVVTYQVGGAETIYKGLDGDEFHSRAHYDGGLLVFDTVEHEDGRKLPETTVWTLSEDRNSFQLKRQSTKSNSSLTHIREH
jgi:hypothetical protein